MAIPPNVKAVVVIIDHLAQLHRCDRTRIKETSALKTATKNKLWPVADVPNVSREKNIAITSKNNAEM